MQKNVSAISKIYLLGFVCSDLRVLVKSNIVFSYYNVNDSMMLCYVHIRKVRLTVSDSKKHSLPESTKHVFVYIENAVFFDFANSGFICCPMHFSDV